MNAGKFKVDIVESVFDHGKYLEWIQENSKSIEEFQQNQGGEKLEEFNRLIQISNSELKNWELKFKMTKNLMIMLNWCILNILVDSGNQ